MVELIKVLNQTPVDYLVGYIFFTLILASIVVNGIVKIVKHLSGNRSSVDKKPQQ